MAEPTIRERLQPSLLDRLTDDEPHERLESREKRVLSPRRLRECVQRDLSWLLNTGNLEQADDLGGFPEVRRSVVNYGAPDLAGVHLSGADLARLERALQRAVLDFEPRLLANSVKVRAVADEARWSHNALSFEIEGMLWSQPLPQRLFLRTEIDLETGGVTLTDVG
jgi:type VI secretion system protein ImpF